MDSGEVWKGPIRSCSLLAKNSPMYLPLETSLQMIASNLFLYLLIESLLGRDCTTVIAGKSILNPIENLLELWNNAQVSLHVSTLVPSDQLCTGLVGSSFCALGHFWAP
jgi:hypothetical protein